MDGERRRLRPDALCPLRPGDPCTLCHPEARLGPQDCPIVALVMDDPELRAELYRRRSRLPGGSHRPSVLRAPRAG